MVKLLFIWSALSALFLPKASQQAVNVVLDRSSDIFSPLPVFGPPKPWNADRVLNEAAELRNRYGLNVSPLMIAAMAQIESSYNPKAQRHEAHLGDSSWGLMQTLLGTAQWLYDDMGYRDFGRPSEKTLTDGRTSLYFGMAYVDWLSRYKGIQRSEQWIVESYNGGPNNSNAQTRNHWAKYQRAKAQIMGVS